MFSSLLFSLNWGVFTSFYFLPLTFPLKQIIYSAHIGMHAPQDSELLTLEAKQLIIYYFKFTKTGRTLLQPTTKVVQVVSKKSVLHLHLSPDTLFKSSIFTVLRVFTSTI